jgi:hypothetical protein
VVDLTTPVADWDVVSRRALQDVGARDIVRRADGSASGVVGTFLASVCIPIPRRWMAEVAVDQRVGTHEASQVECLSRFRLRQGFYARVNVRRADQLAEAVQQRLDPLNDRLRDGS